MEYKIELWFGSWSTPEGPLWLSPDRDLALRCGSVGGGRAVVSANEVKLWPHESCFSQRSQLRQNDALRISRRGEPELTAMDLQQCRGWITVTVAYSGGKAKEYGYKRLLIYAMSDTPPLGLAK